MTARHPHPTMMNSRAEAPLTKGHTMSITREIDYQTEAISEAGSAFRKLSKLKGDLPRTIVLDMGTGMGKTNVIERFIAEYGDDFQFVIFTPNLGELAERTAERLSAGLPAGFEVKTLANLSPNELAHGPRRCCVVVASWSLLTTGIKGGTSAVSRLMREGEDANFIEWLEKGNPKRVESPVPVVFIIDEAHFGQASATTGITQFRMDAASMLGYNPITIEASATPIFVNLDGNKNPIQTETYYHIKKGLERGRAVGMIRNAPILNDGIIEKIEGWDEATRASRGAREIIVEGALAKAERLTAAYIEEDADHLKKYARTLVGIQIPNSKAGDDRIAEIEDILRDHKDSQGNPDPITVENGKLAIYVSGSDPAPIRGINSPDSLVRVLIYKQAIQMGWDCPRAQVHVGFRDIGSPVFAKQSRGRYYRTLGGKHYRNAELNHPYIYTDTDSIRDGFISDKVDGDIDELFSGRLLLDADAARLEEFRALNLPGSAFKRADRNLVDAKVLAAVMDKHAHIIRRTQVITPSELGSRLVSAHLKDVEDGLATVGVVEESELIAEYPTPTEFIDSVMRTFTLDNPDEGYKGVSYGADNRLAEQVSRGIVAPKFRNANLGDILRERKAQGAQVDERSYIAMSFLDEDNYATLGHFVREVIADPALKIKTVTDKAADKKDGVATRESRCWKFTGSFAPVPTIGVSYEVDLDGEPVGEVVDPETLPYRLYSPSPKMREWERSDKTMYRSSLSGPEREFEKFLISMAKSGEIADLWFEKNGESVGDFHIGVRVGDFVSGFYPDYFGVIERKDGRRIPFVFEVKGSKPDSQDGHKGLTLAKAEALRQYAKHTGILSGVVYPSEDKSSWWSLDKIESGIPIGSSLPSYITNGEVSDGETFEHVPFTRDEAPASDALWEWFGGNFGTPTKENVDEARTRRIRNLRQTS